ncbi:hypothetical protein HanPSC8_Chr16g0695751 [Helianthus annuus]|nr:hypothetical protein HanPSC8_Chr16g0695751 [Helianthus annuus]
MTNGPAATHASYATRFLKYTSVFTSSSTTGRYNVNVLTSKLMSDIPPLTGEKRIPALAISVTDGMVISSIFGVFDSPLSSFDFSCPSPRKFLNICSMGSFKSFSIGRLDMILHGSLVTKMTGLPKIILLEILIIPAFDLERIFHM